MSALRPVASVKHFESDRIQIKALVVLEYSFTCSHYLANKSLGDWLKAHKIPAMYGVDTREITKRLRSQGVILGKVAVDGSTPVDALEFEDPNKTNLVAQVSRVAPQVFVPNTSAEDHPDLKKY